MKNIAFEKWWATVKSVAAPVVAEDRYRAAFNVGYDAGVAAATPAPTPALPEFRVEWKEKDLCGGSFRVFAKDVGAALHVARLQLDDRGFPSVVINLIERVSQS